MRPTFPTQGVERLDRPRREPIKSVEQLCIFCTKKMKNHIKQVDPYKKNGYNQEEKR